MNVLQLGIRFVVRKSVKSMLLLLIMFVSTSFIYAGFACQNASIQIQNEGKQAIGGNFRLEGNEANRKARIEVLSAKIGEVPMEVWTDIIRDSYQVGSGWCGQIILLKHSHMGIS